MMEKKKKLTLQHTHHRDTAKTQHVKQEKKIPHKNTNNAGIIRPEEDSKISKRVVDVPSKTNDPQSNNEGSKPSGILDVFINVKNGQIPILLLANNRPEQLQKTFESLLKVRGVSTNQIFMAQDGKDQRVKHIADKFNISSQQHMQGQVFGPPWQVGATRIARHYKWALGNFFGQLIAMLLVLSLLKMIWRFSPDFYEYFQAVAPILDTDKTAWAVSAWNDNGFDYLDGGNKYNLLRTIFPGLGWLMTRELWTKQLQKTWPEQHWDHWLRSEKQHRKREVIYPEFPRVFHAGIKGTFMEKRTHKKYFAQIATNYDPKINWLKGNKQAREGIFHVLHDNYEDLLRKRILGSKPLSALSDFDSFDSSKNKAISVWISVSVLVNQGFGHIAAFLVFGTSISAVHIAEFMNFHGVNLRIHRKRFESC